MKTIAIAVLAVLLSACAATTPQQARDMGPEHRHIFEVNEDYQSVYQRILENSRHCQSGWLITATAQVTGDLYPNTRSATITAGIYGAFGPSLIDVIDIHGLEEHRTEVTVIFPVGNAKNLGKTIETWARTNGASC